MSFLRNGKVFEDEISEMAEINRIIDIKRKIAHQL